MDPISTFNQAMLLLHRQFAEKSQRRERTAAGCMGTLSSRHATPSPADDVQEAIQAQIGALRAAGMDDEGLLFRVAIEILLQREFGADMSNDPSFQQMGDWVCASLREQAHTREMLLALIQDLGD